MPVQCGTHTYQMPEPVVREFATVVTMVMATGGVATQARGIAKMRCVCGEVTKIAFDSYVDVLSCVGRRDLSDVTDSQIQKRMGDVIPSWRRRSCWASTARAAHGTAPDG